MKTEKGSVRVPRSYFRKMAIADYSDYRQALAREFYQNSIDAGASNISVTFDKEENSITVTDNGSGMDYDTIKNRLLVFGGSLKTEGAVGTFGKAKEILYFAWEKYEIKTGDLVIIGQGAEYEIQQQNQNIRGVTSKIWVPLEERRALQEAFHIIAGRTQTTCQIFVDNRQVECELQQGDLIAQNNTFKVYFKKGHVRFWIEVRIGGIWMFHTYTSDIPGSVIVELHDSNMLTSNRDGLTSKHKDTFDNFVLEVIKDQKELLSPQPKTFIEYIKGSGPIAMMRKLIDKMAGIKIKEDPNLSLPDAISQAKVTIGEGMTKSELVKALQNTGAPPIIAELRMNASRPDQWASHLALAGYSPDFLLKYSSVTKKSAVAFIKTKRATKLATAWTEIVKQIMIDNDIFYTFRIGFIFDLEIEAQRLISEDGIMAFLINPKLLCADIKDIDPWTSRKMLMEDLKLKACHEVSHVIRNYHDTDFVGCLHAFIASTWRSERIFTEIKKNCL